MPREFSAGGVVLRSMDGAWQVAVIRPRRENSPDGKPKKTVWALPKGIVDPGEKPEQSAAREVREEAGIEAELVTKLGDVKYVYVRSWGDGARVFKIVSFFLFWYRSGQIGEIKPEMQHEVEAAEWMPLEDAPKRLSYGGEKQMAVRAAQHVAEKARFA